MGSAAQDARDMLFAKSILTKLPGRQPASPYKKWHDHLQGLKKGAKVSKRLVHDQKGPQHRGARLPIAP